MKKVYLFRLFWKFYSLLNFSWPRFHHISYEKLQKIIVQRNNQTHERCAKQSAHCDSVSLLPCVFVIFTWLQVV